MTQESATEFREHISGRYSQPGWAMWGLPACDIPAAHLGTHLDNILYTSACRSAAALPTCLQKRVISRWPLGKWGRLADGFFISSFFFEGFYMVLMGRLRCWCLLMIPTWNAGSAPPLLLPLQHQHFRTVAVEVLWQLDKSEIHNQLQPPLDRSKLVICLN